MNLSRSSAQPVEPRAATLTRLAVERTAAQEHAVRQLRHLARDIDYGYPAAHVRPVRAAANRAVSGYIQACEAFNRAQRRHAR